MKIYTGKKVHCHLKIGVWVVGTEQGSQYCWTTYPRRLHPPMFTCSWVTLNRNNERKIVGYVQCDNEVQETLQARFLVFGALIKNTLWSRNDLSDPMKMYARGKNCVNLRKSYFCVSQYKTVNWSLLFLYVLTEMGYVCTNVHHFVEFTPEKCRKIFEETAVDARSQIEENSNSHVVAETKNCSQSSSGYGKSEPGTVKKHQSDKNGQVFPIVNYSRI